MDNSIMFLGIAIIVGLSITGVILRLWFKNSISFLVGVFFVIATIVAVLVTEFDILENELADKILGAIICTIDAVILVYIFDRYFGKHLRDLTKKIDILAKGDLNVSIDLSLKTRKDELGGIVSSLDTMIISLKESVDIANLVSEGILFGKVIENNRQGDLDIAIKKMVKVLSRISGDIKEAALQVESGSNQISASAQDLASGANEQAASAEEVASSMEEMSTNISQNTENAQQAEQSALLASADIEIVSNSFGESVKAMNEIRNKIQKINDIAERTDLLAINAAIEAARAGESGKGFAVVASEIRELAENSQKAAELISDVAEQSLSKFSESEIKLNDVIPVIQKTGVLVKEIAVASVEQSSGVSEINSALQQLTSVIQNNSSLSEEMASSSEQLTAQSARLNETIAFLKNSNSDLQESSRKELEEQFNKIKSLLNKNNKDTDVDAEKIDQKKYQNLNKPKGFNLDMKDDDFEAYS